MWVVQQHPGATPGASPGLAVAGYHGAAAPSGASPLRGVAGAGPAAPAHATAVPRMARPELMHAVARASYPGAPPAAPQPAPVARQLPALPQDYKRRMTFFGDAGEGAIYKVLDDAVCPDGRQDIQHVGATFAKYAEGWALHKDRGEQVLRPAPADERAAAAAAEERAATAAAEERAAASPSSAPQVVDASTLAPQPQPQPHGEMRPLVGGTTPTVVQPKPSLWQTKPGAFGIFCVGLVVGCAVGFLVSNLLPKSSETDPKAKKGGEAKKEVKKEAKKGRGANVEGQGSRHPPDDVVIDSGEETESSDSE